MKSTKCIWCRKSATTQVTITNPSGRVVFDGPLCQGHTERERRTAELNIHSAQFTALEGASR